MFHFSLPDLTNICHILYEVAKCLKLLICCLFFITPKIYAQSCSEWFSQLNLKDSVTCESRCSVASTDMSTFHCSQECDKLCEVSATFYLLKKYGLTSDEIAICEKKPSICVEAYRLSWKAEEICLQIYPNNKTNDETDACRHFKWAILMANKLGSNDAESVLNAHENNPRQPNEERSMDLSNNRLGLLSFHKLKESKSKFTSEELVNVFKENLKKNNFVILKPRYNNGGLP